MAADALKKSSYGQDWPAYNSAQINEKEIFMRLLAELCGEISEPLYLFGRPKLSFQDMAFSSALKVYTTFSLRRFMTDMTTALEKGYVKHKCSYSSVSNYMRNKELTTVLQDLITLSAAPLKNVETQFAVDSSGLRTTTFTEYCKDKHRTDKKHHWVKVNICCGVKTNVITAVSVTDSHHSDILEFVPLTTQTLRSGFQMKQVSADKAYLSADNFSHIARNGGLAFIPFKKETVVPGPDKQYAWKKMYNYFVFNRDEFMDRYHLRSNVESTFAMLKAKFTDLIRSKDETAQINEVLLKVLCHNVCVIIQQIFELGLDLKLLEES